MSIINKMRHNFNFNANPYTLHISTGKMHGGGRLLVMGFHLYSPEPENRLQCKCECLAFLLTSVSKQFRCACRAQVRSRSSAACMWIKQDPIKTCTRRVLRTQFLAISFLYIMETPKSTYKCITYTMTFNYVLYITQVSAVIVNCHHVHRRGP